MVVYGFQSRLQNVVIKKNSALFLSTDLKPLKMKRAGWVVKFMPQALVMCKRRFFVTLGSTFIDLNNLENLNFAKTLFDFLKVKFPICG